MTIACAIYTRKSSEEGLDQAFNSLDAQREACEAFILSQKSQGWKLTGSYDDGGFSGGNVERPGLQRLMSDITSRRVQVVVVYKVDRLTRSLADFAKLVELFDAKGVSFVSVTQQFNTTSSMGRLTLNVLLSFAQFEREVTSERIRDKIAASKRKGMWMGGCAPMGYLVRDRSLVVDEPQAERVRSIMRLYLEMGSVTGLKVELDARGWKTSERPGKRPGGRSFSRGHLRKLITSPFYVGRVPHKEQAYPGLHPAIVEESLWQAVQDKLAKSDERHRSRAGAAEPSPLSGLLIDAGGRRFDGVHANKDGKRFRYYCRRLESGDSEADGFRVPALAIEKIVLAELCGLLRNEEKLSALMPAGEDAATRLATCSTMANQLEQGSPSDRVCLLKALLMHVVIETQSIEIVVRKQVLVGSTPSEESGRYSLTVPVMLRRSGFATRLALRPSNAPVTKGPDPKVVAVLTKANRWFSALRAGSHTSIVSIAQEHNVARAAVTSIVYLAFLAPSIVERVVHGTQPAGFNVRRLMKLGPLPLAWDEQRRMLGFDG